MFFYFSLFFLSFIKKKEIKILGCFSKENLKVTG